MSGRVRKTDVRAIDQATALRIFHALARLMRTGEGDVKRLQEIDPPEFRLRVGDYRVRFHDLETPLPSSLCGTAARRIADFFERRARRKS